MTTLLYTHPACLEHDFAAPLIAEQTLALYRDLLRARADRR